MMPYDAFEAPHGDDADFLAYVEVPEWVLELHAILPIREQHAILNASWLAFQGREVWAEQVRAQANYDNLQHRPDADQRSGTV